MEKEKTITISLEEYISLKRDEIFLASLEENGVDNWAGYSESEDIFIERLAKLNIKEL